jgi:ABC-type glutathione transport system ATPase component
VVANRLSLLRRADVILVLDKGRLVEQGSHETLVRAPGLYRETALLQFMDVDGESENCAVGAPRFAVHGPQSTFSQ